MRDSFATRSQLEVAGQSYAYASLPRLGQRFDIARLVEHRHDNADFDGLPRRY